MVRRYLVVHLPAFRLERCGYSGEDLAALIALEKNATRLVALTPAALQAGLRRGITATEARALIPHVELLPWDAAGEQQDRTELLRGFGALSDRVVFPWEDGLALEITHVCNGALTELAVAERAIRLAAELGHQVRVAVADDPVAARAIAQWVAENGGVVVVDPGEGARALAPLPLVALHPEEELLAALRVVGVETIGQWAGLDPAAVAGRYGGVAARLHRVARGGTASLVSVDRGPDPERPSARVVMAGATTHQELAFVLPGLLAELAAQLAERDLAAIRLRIVLRLEPMSGVAPSQAVVVRVGRATRSVRALERLVRSRLERVTVEAPVDELGIEVIETAPDTGWQPGLADRTEAGEPLPDLLARLGDQLGDEALFSPVLASEWRPEAAWKPGRYPPPLLVVKRTPKPTDPVEIQEQWEHGWPLPRPSLLLPSPERVEVATVGEVPVRLRLAHGWRKVERSAGPERLTGQWWERTNPLEREYWVLEAEGRTIWVYRDPAEVWWLHGWFD